MTNSSTTGHRWVLAFGACLTLAGLGNNASGGERTIDLGEQAKLRLVSVPAGKFILGSPKGGLREETPAHEVHITRAFSIGVTEVTRGQWKAVMGQNPPDVGVKDQTDDHPVLGLTWYEAVEFCQKLSAKDGAKYRLPTEAEWEYACRAGTTTAYSFGEKPDSTKVVCEADVPRGKSIERAHAGPAKVGSLAANAWGLKDMHGNAHEWCYDHFHGEAYVETLITRFMEGLPKDEHAKWANSQKDPICGYGYRPDCPTGEETARISTPRLEKALETPLVDPLGPPRGQADKRVIRGGGWGQPLSHCRSASRFGADPLWRNQAIGFRVVCEDGKPGLSASMRFAPAPANVEIPGHGRLPSVFVTPTGQRFNLIVPGTFLMGISPEETDVMVKAETAAKRMKSSVVCGPFGPIAQKKVTFSSPFYLASTLHTAGTSAVNLVDDLVRKTDRQPHLHPVGYESDRPDTQPLYDAIDRLLVMSLHDGRLYRLPTEPELEYATRAGTTTAWYWGNDVSVYFDYECLRGPAYPSGDGDRVRHVGRKHPNAWGFYDMLCNSTAWTSTPHDWIATGEVTDPAGDPIGKPTAPSTVYARRGMGYRYQLACNGASQLRIKFGNYRNCTRVGGYRLAFDASELTARPVDDAWRTKIHVLRVANFVAGGNYGLTYEARMKLGHVVDGEEGCGAISVNYFRKALALDPANKAALAGLRRVKEEMLPFWRTRLHGDATRTADVEKMVDALLTQKQDR